MSMKLPPAATYASRTAKDCSSSAVQPKTLPPRARACRQTAVVARRAAGRRMVRAIARRRNGLVAELLGHFGNAASVRARRRPAGGSLTTGPRGKTWRSEVPRGVRAEVM
ncbi:hypothetical protein DBP12_18220 [Streptomyces sp. CS014]|nr:hypothetical protein DBP12_18220 [Streptomyces sp. CS014]